MSQIPKTAFILSAGKGTRLRPHTDNTPKPMVKVWDKPILDHIINKCKKDGIRNIIINLNYLGNVIENHLSDKTDVNLHLSREEELLDTGGGVKFARDYIYDDAFFLINGDAFWTEGDNKSAFQRLSDAWDPEKMDILLLLQPVVEMKLTSGVGDYDLDEDGHAIRSSDKTGKYMFTGIRITKSDIVDDIDKGIFSFLECMDAAQKEKKLYGLVHDGQWHHISTPEDLERVNDAK